MSVDLRLILLGLLKAMGQPCSPSDKKETDPDLISGVREGELACLSPLPTQICADALPVPCPFLHTCLRLPAEVAALPVLQPRPCTFSYRFLL